ncbi:MAG: glycine zipper 2TM domain-containing protein [Pseudomonadales bacterium]
MSIQHSFAVVSSTTRGLVAASLVLASTYSQASDISFARAEVVGVEPLYETVTYSVPAEVCREQEVAYAAPRRGSLTGPILGAVIGGAIGNAVGHRKRNKQVGTAVGAVLGGSIGADVARRNRYERDHYRTETVCHTRHEQRSEEREVGYRVAYAYGGETYHTQMDQHPGATIRVRVAVSPVGH